MTEQKRRLSKRHTQCLADDMGMPMEVAAPAMIVYRSTGIGIFGVVGRWVGMPLEKIALFMNSSQVSGSGQLGQAIKLTFEKGVTAPWRVVGPAREPRDDWSRRKESGAAPVATPSAR